VFIFSSPFFQMQLERAFGRSSYIDDSLYLAI